jgi:hypothetical protein
LLDTIRSRGRGYAAGNGIRTSRKRVLRLTPEARLPAPMPKVRKRS